MPLSQPAILISISISKWCHHYTLPFSRAYLCCSQVQTSLQDMSCFHCSRMCSARRTHPLADKTCCSRSRSSARHSWPGSGTRTGPRGHCESASANAGWGWSYRNERLSLSTSHLHLKCQFWHNTEQYEFSVQSNVEGRKRKVESSSLHYAFWGLQCFPWSYSGNPKTPQEFWHKLQKIS